MKTKDRILATSLLMFNDVGEPNVTTLDIATELDISPGNLYYHFKGKDAIIDRLFDSFEGEMNDLQVLDPLAEEALLDMWAYLQLSFEVIARFVFLYRDIADLLARYPDIRRRFNRILARQRASLHVLCEAMRADDVLRASSEEVEYLVDHLTMTMAFWMNYQRVQSDPTEFAPDLLECASRVIRLLLPYLDPDSREGLADLAL